MPSAGVASIYQQPLHLAESGRFQKNPGDDTTIMVAIKDFKTISYISKGSFGHVHKTRFRDELDVAQKICILPERREKTYQDQDISLEPWYRELSFHRSSKHEHIVRLHGFIAISDGQLPADRDRPRALHLFLELMTCSFREVLNSMLYRYPYNSITPFKKEAVVHVEPFRAFLKHVCSGLIYLHDSDYMHRDLKPGNILLKAEGGTAVAKLTDFGTIKDYKDTTQGADRHLHSADPGTTKYSAPEVVYNDERYSTSCDLWSVSITSVQLLSGYHPVVTDDQRSRYSSSKSSNTIYCRSISSDDIFTDLPEKMGLEGELAAVLGRCLDRDAESRPTAGEVLGVVGNVENDGELLFEWFSSLDIWEDIQSNRRQSR